MPTTQLYTHRSYMGAPAPIRSTTDLFIGDVVRFTYKGEIKHVFILDPNHKKKLHGLTLDKLPRYALVGNVISRMDRTDDPFVLYEHYLKGHIEEFDAYRTYFLKDIKNIYRFSYHLDDIQKGDTDLDEEQDERNANGR